MKKMTKQEFLDSKVGKFFELSYDSYDRPYLHVIGEEQALCSCIDMGIELTPDKPPITIENLGRFLAEFGEYPKAELYYETGSILGYLLHIGDSKRPYYGMCESKFRTSSYVNCEITDERWTAENLGGEV